jgi:predicted RNA-binding Zn ribbon-like protein
MSESTVDREGQATATAADLVMRFVNTRATGSGQPELLGDAGALTQWLRQAGLIDEESAVTDADAAEARELREALGVVLLDHVGMELGHGVLGAAETHLQRSAGMHPLNLVVRADGCELVSPQTGVAAAFGAILAAVSDTSTQGLWIRLKMCSNPPCHASFLDNTRNSGGLYCGSTCRSQMSMRAYRGRQRSTG